MLIIKVLGTSKYHPEYVYSDFEGPQVAKFRIIKELDLNVKTK